jgi:hypothetical protein
MTAHSTQTLPHDAAQLAPPVFLVGAERSGTTLVRLMLDHHPAIAFHPESEYMVDQIPDHGPLPTVDQYSHWLSHQPNLHDNGLTLPHASTLPELLDKILRQKQQQTGKTVIGATVHRHFHRLPRIWPNARFIHLVRDPRDVARSCIVMGWAGNVYTGVRNWVEVERLWDAFQPTLPRENWIELIYEDLIREPEKALTRVCQFLGLPFDRAIFDYIDHSTYEFPDPKLIGQWRGKLSPFNQRLIETQTAELLTRRGYDPSGQPPLNVNFFLRRWLFLHDRYIRVRGRLARYGLSLCAADFLARRLRLHAWHHRVEAQMHQIRKAHWK